MHLFIWLVLVLVPFYSCYKSTDLSVLDFSTAGPQKGSNLTNLQRDLPEGGQLSPTEGKLLNLQTYLGEWLEQTSLFPPYPEELLEMVGGYPIMQSEI